MSIDTIQLKIPRNEILIERMSFFNDRYSSVTLEREDRKTVHATNKEYRRAQKTKKRYVPKFWLEHTTWNPTPDYLVLEMSIPKFLFGTSLYSANESHLSLFIEKTNSFLRDEIYLKASKESIKNAIVTQLAYAKNIEMSRVCTTQQALQIIAPFSYRPSSRYEKKWYEKSGGVGIKYYNSHTSFGIYEKLPEIAAHAITGIELEISRQWQKSGSVTIEHINQASEVLRFEYTMQNKQAVNQQIRRVVKKKKEYTVADVFSSKISSELVSTSVEVILNQDCKDTFFLPTFSHPHLQNVMREYVPVRSARNEVTAVMHGLQEMGIKRYRLDFIRDYSRRTWYRRMEQIKLISQHIDWQKLPKNTNRDVLHHILREFDIEPKYAQPEQQKLVL